MGQIQPKRSAFFRRWGPVLAAAVTALTIWLSARKVNFGAVGQAFARADYALVAAATVLSLLAVLVLSLRWRLLLRWGGDAPLGKIFRVTVVSQYINILAPGRFGELAKAVLVARGAPFPAAFALGTVAVEKALDLLVFFALWALVPAFLPLRDIVKERTAAAVLGGALLAGLAFFVWKPDWVLCAARRIVRLLPERFRRGGGDFAEKSVEALQALRDFKTASGLAGLTLLVLALEILPIWLLLRAFYINVPFWAAFFVFIVLLVGKLPPSLPGKVGIYQFAVILALAPFGVGKDAALSYGIMLHAVTFIPRIVLGLVFAAGLGVEAWRAETRREGTAGAPDEAGKPGEVG